MSNVIKISNDNKCDDVRKRFAYMATLDRHERKATVTGRLNRLRSTENEIYDQIEKLQEMIYSLEGKLAPILDEKEDLEEFF